MRRQEHPEAYTRKVLVNRHRSLLRRLRLEARHAGRERAEPFDLGPHEELMVSGRPSAGSRPATGRDDPPDHQRPRPDRGAVDRGAGPVLGRA